MKFINLTISIKKQRKAPYLKHKKKAIIFDSLSQLLTYF